jgi:transcriptional regulator GlxA family with amidase domain
MALDLVGPMETFAAATQIGIGGAPAHCYETIVIGQTGNPFTAESGLTMQPHCALADAPTLDTLIVPGGVGLRRPETLAAIVPWLKERAAGTRRVASVCTGIYGLAETGLLDGRRVTTHWGFTRAVARQYPKLRVDGNAIFIRDNRFYTSAGVTAGIDLSLALIEEDFGARLALSVARELVVFLKRPGGQEQYSEPLQFQAQSTGRFADLVPWIGAHLSQDLSVEALAGWACLSPRQFGRRFKAAFGTTPADFVEEMRLNEARHRLGQPGSSIENVALSVGFRSADVFRRAFERRFGSTPTAYRERFDSGLQPDRRGPSRAVELPATV